EPSTCRSPTGRAARRFPPPSRRRTHPARPRRSRLRRGRRFFRRPAPRASPFCGLRRLAANRMPCLLNSLAKISGLEEPEVFLLFPLRDRLVEAVPLVLLMPRVEPVHRVAEHMFGERIVGKPGNGLIKISRQRLHVEFVTLLRRHFVQ